MTPCNTMTFPTVGVSRCGEIFVTNNAKKWTFFCSYCQKTTSDIGVFICHIRLDHLSSLSNFDQQEDDMLTPETMETKPMSTIHFGSSQDTDANFIKEETISQCSTNNTETFRTKNPKIVNISSLTYSNNVESLFSENSISMVYPAIETQEEVFTITQRENHCPEENNEVVRVVYNKDEKSESNINTTNDETISIDDDDDDAVNGPDTYSIYSSNSGANSINDDNTDFEINDDNRASSSKHRKTVQQDVQHICEVCNLNFKFRRELDHHLKINHQLKPNETALTCKKCTKKFRSVAGLKNHLKAHDEKYQIQCPICQATHNQNYFITHILTHESETCFPCQVCGKIYTNNEERVKHWETHADEMPFECDFCYRRFRKQQYLTHHLKSHFQYHCQFCPTHFNSAESQKPPYVCTTCGNLPDIKKKIQTQRLSINKFLNQTPKAKFKALKPLKH